MRKIRTGAVSGATELEEILGSGVRILLRRRMDAPVAEARASTILLRTADAIRSGAIQESGDLIAIVRGMIRQETSAPPVRAPLPASDAERDFSARVSGRDHEALHQFFVEGLAVDRICRSLDLTHAEFQEIKARARRFFRQSRC